MGAFACFFTIFTSVALNAYFEVFDLYSSAPIAAYLVIIMMCITGGKCDVPGSVMSLEV